MSNICIPHDQATRAAEDHGLAGLMPLLAAGAGLSVASIYYAQPLLGVLGSDLRVPASQTGWIPTATQAG